MAHLAVGELAPNTPYTIYAVAGSPMGIAGSIAVKEVVTTDGITVKLVDYDDTVSDSTLEKARLLPHTMLVTLNIRRWVL